MVKLKLRLKAIFKTGEQAQCLCVQYCMCDRDTEAFGSVDVDTQFCLLTLSCPAAALWSKTIPFFPQIHTHVSTQTHLPLLPWEAESHFRRFNHMVMRSLKHIHAYKQLSDHIHTHAREAKNKHWLLTQIATQVHVFMKMTTCKPCSSKAGEAAYFYDVVKPAKFVQGIGALENDHVIAETMSCLFCWVKTGLVPLICNGNLIKGILQLYRIALP